MSRRLPSCLGIGIALSALLLAAGCGEEEFKPGSAPNTQTADTSTSQAGAPSSVEAELQGAALLKSVIQLVEDASNTPGGKNFDIATDYLNHYFAGVDAAAFAMRPETRSLLLELKLPEQAIADHLEPAKFTSRDARHIEDCLLYQGVASHVAGTGDDLSRIRRLFDWVVRQVLLVPPEALGVPGNLQQAQARPHDVLVRGMATEIPGDSRWAERGWVFMALARQLGVDIGLVTIQPKDGGEAKTWLTAAAIDGKLYLFDARLGLEVPGPDGQGPATLDQVLAEPSLLDRLDIAGEGTPKYDVHAADLADARIGIALDSTLRYHAPRMKLLQRDLAGKNRMVLYRDATDQRDAFAAAIGDRFAGASLWLLPIEVEARLFTDPAFNQATGVPLQMYNPLLPLLGPRLMQLRGDLPPAIQSYVNMRYKINPVLADAKKTPIPPEIQAAVDMHATYLMALAQLDKRNLAQAANLFGQTIKFLPEPHPGPPFFPLFHYGAVSNLGRMKEEEGKNAEAVAFYVRPNPTPQGHGNLYRAQEIVKKDPTAAPKDEPKAEEPKPDAPKPEAPKAEEPRSDEPKADAPKAEEPKADAPKAEAGPGVP